MTYLSPLKPLKKSSPQAPRDQQTLGIMAGMPRSPMDRCLLVAMGTQAGCHRKTVFFFEKWRLLMGKVRNILENPIGKDWKIHGDLRVCEAMAHYKCH